MKRVPKWPRSRKLSLAQASLILRWKLGSHSPLDFSTLFRVRLMSSMMSQILVDRYKMEQSLSMKLSFCSLCSVPQVAQEKEGGPRYFKVREPQMHFKSNHRMVRETSADRANRRPQDWSALGTRKVLKFLRICLIWLGC